MRQVEAQVPTLPVPRIRSTLRVHPLVPQPVMPPICLRPNPVPRWGALVKPLTALMWNPAFPPTYLKMGFQVAVSYQVPAVVQARLVASKTHDFLPELTAERRDGGLVTPCYRWKNRDRGRRGRLRITALVSGRAGHRALLDKGTPSVVTARL